MAKAVAATSTKPTSKKAQVNDKRMPSDSESSSEEGDSGDEVSPLVKSTPASAKKTAAAAPSDDPSSSEESSSEEDSEISERGKATVKSIPAAVKKAVDSSGDSSAASSSEESSSEDSDTDRKGQVPVKTNPPAVKKQVTETSDVSSEDSDDEDEGEMASIPANTTTDKGAGKPSDASSSEESSDESDSEKGDDEISKPTAPLTEANKKRKAETDTVVVPKKVKLANGNAGAVTSNDETKSIFVGRLSWNVDNDWLAQEFAECGEVESAHVQMDRNTGRSRGFGFVHFKTADAVEKALALNGKEIDGRAVNIDKSSPPDKKASSERRAQTFGDTTSPPSAVLFVGNLSFGVNEDTLWETFGEHGDVKSVRVPTDRDTGRPKGFAYVEFSDTGSAKKAHGALQGFELEGRSLRLDFSQPRDNTGGRGGAQSGRGGRGRGGFGTDRGRGGGRGGRGEYRGARGRGRGARTGGITHFEGQKITFD